MYLILQNTDTSCLALPADGRWVHLYNTQHTTHYTQHSTHGLTSSSTACRRALSSWTQHTTYNTLHTDSCCPVRSVDGFWVHSHNTQLITHYTLTHVIQHGLQTGAEVAKLGRQLVRLGRYMIDYWFIPSFLLFSLFSTRKYVVFFS